MSQAAGPVMKRRGGRSQTAFVLAGAVALMVGGAAVAETRRFAVVLGNNAGSGARPPLRFAETDAAKMGRVLTELGEVSSGDLFLLTGAGVAEVESAMREVRIRVDQVHRDPDTRAVVVFYYSGHSDGEALELGSQRLSYGALKAMLAGTGAELKVAIIDACRSGAAVMEKGGRPAPAFTIRLSDQLMARGEVFITSSAHDESALESSEVMGSYFTHNLISGLRGAADASGDRQVTLAEAYRYAYDRTVSATAITPAGAQHPAYDYKLQGQGELVLSSLLRSSSTLELPAGAERAVVTDLTRDQVVAEIMPGAAREIALAAGTYGVRVLRAGQSYGGRFRVAERTRYAVRWEDLDALNVTPVALKGGAAGGGVVVPASVSQSARSHSLDAEVNVDANVERGARLVRSRGGPLFGLSLGGGSAVTPGTGLQGLLRLSFEPTALTGFSFAVLGATGSGLSGAVGESSLQVRAGYRSAIRTDRLYFSIGAEAGAAHIWLTDAAGARTQFGFVAGPRAAFRVRVGGRAWLGVEGEAPLALVNEPGGLRASVMPTAVLGMAVEL